jgi:hypothetical protein
MTARSSRPYGGVADLRRMQAAVARAYLATSLRVGDLAWLSRYHTHRELSLNIRLWEDDGGHLVGWTFFRSHGGFNVFVAPGRADDALLDEMLAVVDEIARASVAAGDPPVGLYTYGVDLSRSAEDRALAAALERHGFKGAPSPGGVMTRVLDRLPGPGRVDRLPPRVGSDARPDAGTRGGAAGRLRAVRSHGRALRAGAKDVAVPGRPRPDRSGGRRCRRRVLHRVARR